MATRKSTKTKDKETFTKLAKVVEEREVDDYIEKNYLPYSWAVCLDRALVFAQDGLKPIQRRILYTAYKNNITDKSGKMKSATFEGKTLEYSPHGGCLRGDTKIYTIQKGAVEIEYLYQHFKNGGKPVDTLCFSEDTGQIETGKITKVWITKYVNELYAIHLSDGSVVYATDNHPFLLNSEEFVRADELEENDLLRSFCVKDNNIDITVIDDEKIYNFSRTKNPTPQTGFSKQISIDEIVIEKYERAIPVYDFTEEKNHNAFVVINDSYKRESDTLDVICVHNSYGAIVNIAAPEVPGAPRSIRVPLIRGKGNWGGISDPPAAARYTEMNLWPAAMLLLEELNENAVDMVPNYNNTDMEPVYLPAKWPVAFINGVSDAMAVGFASNLPSHNPGEVMDACIALIKNPDMTIQDLEKIINGPDFDCGCDIIANIVRDGKTINGIKSYLETGHGSFVMKAVYTLEESQGAYTIHFTKLPYKISPEKVIDEIKKNYEKGQLREIASWKDLSDIDNPVHLEITTKRNININKVLNDLFTSTSLKCNFAANNTIVSNNIPQQMDVKFILSEFLAFRKQCTRRKLTYRLAAKQKKLKIQEAIKSVLADIDRCIEIIRKAKDESYAKQQLMKIFGLDDEQANYILSIQLRKLTKADVHEVTVNVANLKKEIRGINKVLNNNNDFINFIVDELEDTKEKINSPRKCRIMLKEKKSGVDDKDIYIEVKDGRIMRTFDKIPGAYLVNDEGKILVVTKDKAFIRSVYDLSNNRPTLFSSKLKFPGEALTIAGAEGYLLLVGKEGNMKLVDLENLNYPRKDAFDKILAQEVVFADVVTNLKKSIMVNDNTKIKLSDIPIQSLTTNGKKMLRKGTIVETVTIL